MLYEHFTKLIQIYSPHAWVVCSTPGFAKRECLDVCAASRVLDNWLGPESSLAGPISGKQTFSIELDKLIYLVVDDVDDIEDNEAGEDMQALQT